MKQTNILLTGEGGQGIQTIAKVIANAAFVAGDHVSYIPSFGVEQRGTPSTAFIIISSEPIHYPRFDRADHVVVLQKRAVSVIKSYVDENTQLIFDSSTLSKKDLPKVDRIYGLPATKLAYEEFTPRAFNVIMAGKLSQVLGLDKKVVWEQIAKTLGKKFKDQKIKELNEKAFEAGRRFIFEIDHFTRPTFSPSLEQIIAKGHGKKAQILPKYCKGCGICLAKCPVGALKFSDMLGVFATPVPEIDLEKCIACGNCFRFCPDGAILVEKDKPNKQA